MDLSVNRIIDVQGRIWFNVDNNLILDNSDHPRMSPNHQSNHREFLLTDDGRIYSLITHSTLPVPDFINDFIINRTGIIYALTDRGIILRIGDPITQIAEGISYLLAGGDLPEDNRLLVITSDNILSTINNRGEIMEVFTEIKSDVIKIKDNYIITTDGYINFRMGHNNWVIREYITNFAIVDIIFGGSEYTDRNYEIDILLTNTGELRSRWIDHDGNFKDIECSNRDLIELNLQYRWTKLVNIFKEYYGLVNEIGEIYSINNDFLASTTNLPMSIYAIPYSRAKSARRR